MGTCFSKKNASAAVPAATDSVSVGELKESCDGTQKVESESKIKKAEQVKELEESGVKKEIFVIKHRKSHDRDKQKQDAATLDADNVAATATTNCDIAAFATEAGNNNNGIVRTSSCTKEEVDAILIQCGRLSRSNSSGKIASSGRKYSGSKRSYDFDHQDNDVESASADNDDKKGIDSYCNEEDDETAAERRQHRQRHRQTGSRPSSSQGRRRTPSREREQNHHHQQRSGSRERGSGSGTSGRRVSRSPGRRSETTPSASYTINRPGKMLSVPATVSSLVMDKSNNVGNGGETGNAAEPTTTAIKRISVKRNVGEPTTNTIGSRGAASPRSQSPSRTNGKVPNENQQQPSLSRSSSRKAEHSPYRRNPLSDIDPNSMAHPQSAGNKAPYNNRIQNRMKETEGQNQLPMQKPNAEMSNERVFQGTNCRSSSKCTPNNKAVNGNCTAKEQKLVGEEAIAELPMACNVAMTTVVASGAEGLKRQTLTRSRSGRRSRDLDINPETLLNPAPSYTTLLLEDIQNFHQKNAPSFSLPQCVSKACSILEAVADLNSTTSSNMSCAFSEDRKGPTAPADQPSHNGYNVSAVPTLVGKNKDPFVESEVLGSDDLIEPSFHKYVTVRRGCTLGGGDMDDQESSGSNSFVSGNQQNWGFSSCSWEPNSADSTDRWSSRSKSREEVQSSPLPNLSESGHHDTDKARRGFSGRRTGIGRGRLGASEGLNTIPVVAASM